MLFSSPIFLFLFLPITLLGYYIGNKASKNYWLLAASLVFFAWSGLKFTAILLFSIVINYAFGLIIEKNKKTNYARYSLITGLSINIGLLAVFKYANFTVANLNKLLHFLHFDKLASPEIILPIGISFYTFHSISYLVDIYRGKTSAQKNIFNLALYIAMFSQLIAGPIIRYSDVWQQLTTRTHSFFKFTEGVERFLIGLAKKVLLANVFGFVSDKLLGDDTMQLNAANAWLGIICYTLQIYCDFAGYSDMAIGLGKMFGFDFMENFNYPYIAKSIKEFWRRWHISLSSFFKDYVYIPLGGNRVSPKKQYLNLIIVFFITGLWHGASWTFIIWGLFHGFFLLVEKAFLSKLLEKTWKPLANLYTLTVVIFAWVLFKKNHLGAALHYWKEMFTFNLNPEQNNLFFSFMNPEFYLAITVTILGSFGFFNLLSNKLNIVLSTNTPINKPLNIIYHTITAFFYGAILILCSIYLIAGTYNPFIYYQF